MFKPQRGSHKLKYRYFYHPKLNQLIRFNIITGAGNWRSKDGRNKFYETTCGMKLEEYTSEIPTVSAFEVTLSQGLHYMKGNYCE